MLFAGKHGRTPVVRMGIHAWRGDDACVVPPPLSSTCGPVREGARTDVAGRPSRARRGGEHTYARTAPGSAHACVARLHQRERAGNAPTGTRRDLRNGFAWPASLVERGLAARWALPLRPANQAACSVRNMRVMAAHEDSDAACGRWSAPLALSNCCDRCVTRARAETQTHATHAGERVSSWPASWRRGSFQSAGGWQPPAPRSMTSRSRRSARKPIATGTPPSTADSRTGLIVPGPRTRTAMRRTTVRTLLRRGAAAFARTRWRAERDRTDDAAVAAEGLARRERRRAEQPPTSIRQISACEEHPPSLRSDGNCCDHRPPATTVTATFANPETS